MRALILPVVIAVAACSPDIVSGAYLCGPEQFCPGDQACDGSDNTCVIASTTTPFACLPSEEHEPDNTPATGTAISGLTCVSTVFSEHGCLAAGDAQDWFQFTAPTGCAAIEVEIRVSFPVAYEPLAVVLTDGTGTAIATDTACKTPDGTNGNQDRCLTQTLDQGASYAIEIKPAGGGDCDGTCNFNRYLVNVQVATPG